MIVNRGTTLTHLTKQPYNLHILQLINLLIGKILTQILKF